jgi:hypothetical protein
MCCGDSFPFLWKAIIQILRQEFSSIRADTRPGRERSIRDPGRATHPDVSEARQVIRDQLSDLTAAVHAAAPIPAARQILASIGCHAGYGWRGLFFRKGCSMEYAVTAAFLLSVVAGSFAAVIFGGFGIAQLIASAL